MDLVNTNETDETRRTQISTNPECEPNDGVSVRYLLRKSSCLCKQRDELDPAGYGW